jgi:hypothetical protein
MWGKKDAFVKSHELPFPSWFDTLVAFYQPLAGAAEGG